MQGRFWLEISTENAPFITRSEYALGDYEDRKLYDISAEFPTNSSNNAKLRFSCQGYALYLDDIVFEGKA